MATKGMNRADQGSSYDYFPITPNDDADIAVETRAICVAVGGTLKVTRIDDTVVALTVPAGVIPIQVKRVWATGTAATGITGLV